MIIIALYSFAGPLLVGNLCRSTHHIEQTVLRDDVAGQFFLSL